MNRRQVIVMLSPRFPPETYGGAEQQCLRLSQAISGMGVPVTVLTTCKSRRLCPVETVDALRIVRFVTTSPPDHGGREILSSLIWTYRCLAWIVKNRDRIKLIHVHQGKFHVLPALLANVTLGLPFVVKVGNAEEEFDYSRLATKKGGYGKFTLWWLLKSCSRHIAISSRIADQMTAMGVPPERVLRIPNGIDVTRFGLSPTVGLERRWTFLFLGRLEDEKQPMLLLQSFFELLERHRCTSRDLRLIVGGDGARLEDMKRFVREKGIGEQVRLLGRVDDVKDLYACANFFVLPSRNEGLSNALLEAMSCGLVAIASAVSGSTDALRHGVNGFLFPRDDPSALADCLEIAATMPDETWRAMRQAARRTIEEEFDMNHVAARYVELYESVPGVR